MRRTIPTARNLVAFIRGHLSRGTNIQLRIARLYVDAVEELNVFETHNMLEVPADERIHARDRGQRVRQHRRESPSAEIPHQAVRPQCEFQVEATTKYRRVDVDPTWHHEF